MNPYRILNIDNNASKREIVRAAAQALRERRFSIREVAVAQKQLLDPTSKYVHDFIQCIDVKPILDKLDVTRPKERRVSHLKYLTIFDEDV